MRPEPESQPELPSAPRQETAGNDHPWRKPETSVLGTPLRTQEHLSPRRHQKLGGKFAALTLSVSLIAVVMEGILHPCAGLFSLDPIPHPAVLLLYILTVFMLGFNRWLLEGQGERARGGLSSPRVLGLSLVGTMISLLIALATSYMFIPLAPFGVMLLMMGGIGLLILTPYLALFTLIGQLRGLLRAWKATGASAIETARTVGAATLAAFSLLFWLIGAPMLAANFAAIALNTEGDKQKAALQALRLLGGESILLDLAYQRKPSYWACLGYNAPERGWWPEGGYRWSGYLWNGQGSEVEKARRTYFLLTGRPFEQADPPVSYRHTSRRGFWGGPTDVEVEETGGYLVGRRVPGLTLSHSERKVSAFHPESDSGEVEWTLRFRNDTTEPQEARADILIPEAGVVSQVSLWINGREQPARYGHPQRVRAAYTEIAVVQKRDPLLVTMPAPGHVLAQCFPVPARGEMQIKLVFTLPLEGPAPGAPEGTLRLPAFGMVNFAIPEVPGESEFTRRGVGLYRPDYFPGPPTISMAPLHSPVDLILMVDASEGMNGLLSVSRREEMEATLRRLPPGSRYRLLSTGDSAFFTPWLACRSARLDGAFFARKYSGGTDPAPALARLALPAALEEAENPSAILFLHSASPAHLSNLDAVRALLRQNQWGGPALIAVQMAVNAPDALVSELSGFPRVHTLRALSADRADAAELTGAIYFAASVASAGKQGQIQQREGQQAARLFLRGETPPVEPLALNALVNAAWRHANTLPAREALDIRIAAGRAAAEARLVTPLSSAVVLETEAQYQRHGLKKAPEAKGDPQHLPQKGDTFKQAPAQPRGPSLPEPGTLCLTACIALPLLASRWKWQGARRQR